MENPRKQRYQFWLCLRHTVILILSFQIYPHKRKKNSNWNFSASRSLFTLLSNITHFFVKNCQKPKPGKIYLPKPKAGEKLTPAKPNAQAHTSAPTFIRKPPPPPPSTVHYYWTCSTTIMVLNCILTCCSIVRHHYPLHTIVTCCHYHGALLCTIITHCHYDDDSP